MLGSGSRGNAIALRTDDAVMLIDAGFGPRALTRRAKLIDLSLEPLVGVALTHEHGDHARGAAALAARSGCPIIASPGTLQRLAPAARATGIPLEPRRPLTVGPFTLEAARTNHDASEPFALAVTGPDGSRVGIAHDLGRVTSAVRYLLRGCAVLVIEANHDEVMLRTGPYPASVRQRIAGSGGHLSNRAAAELAAEACGDELEAVVLVHVSEQCNQPALALETVQRALTRRGFRGRVLVAEQHVPSPVITVRGGMQLSLTLPGRPGPRLPGPPAAPIPASSG